MLDTSRARPIFDPRNTHSPVLVAGVGATGSHIVAQLVAYGVNHVTFVDDDTVSPHNLPNQVFQDRDIGLPKVEAMHEYIRDKYLTEEDHGLAIIEVAGRLPEVLPRCNTGFRAKTLDTCPVIFLCVDSMEARKQIVDALYKEYEERGYDWVVIDTRMASTHGNIINFAISDKSKWEKTLIRDEDAEMSPCGAAITCVSTTQIIASLAVWEYLKMHVDPEAVEERIDVFLKPLSIHTRRL